ncbi:hypothetical protein [Corynebacterium callunae]|nr:hypothetical protein [Corynebacterium callunae]
MNKGDNNEDLFRRIERLETIVARHEKLILNQEKPTITMSIHI